MMSINDAKQEQEEEIVKKEENLQDSEDIQPEFKVERKPFVGNLCFTSPLIHVSRKKLLPVMRYVGFKKFNIEQAIMYFYCVNKRYARHLHKFFKSIVKNMVYQYECDEPTALKRRIRFIVLEKTSTKRHGLLYAAKGRAYRTCSISTRLRVNIE